MGAASTTGIWNCLCRVLTLPQSPKHFKSSSISVHIFCTPTTVSLRNASREGAAEMVLQAGAVAGLRSRFGVLRTQWERYRYHSLIPKRALHNLHLHDCSRSIPLQQREIYSPWPWAFSTVPGLK